MRKKGTRIIYNIDKSNFCMCVHALPNDTCHAYCFIITCKNYTSFSTHTGFLHIYFALHVACLAYRALLFLFVRLVIYFTQHIIRHLGGEVGMFYKCGGKTVPLGGKYSFNALYTSPSVLHLHTSCYFFVFSHYTHHNITVFFPFSILVTQHPQKERMKEKTSHLHDTLEYIQRNARMFSPKN